MNVLHVADREGFDLLGVARSQMLETITEANDLIALADTFDGGSGNNAIQAWSGTAADQNT
jgi:hypothetical protein